MEMIDRMIVAGTALRYVIPGGMHIKTAILNMIALAKKEDQLRPGVSVVAEHNGIELVVTATSTPDEVLDVWDLNRVNREMRNQRLDPLRTSIRYLLSTVSQEDRLLLIKACLSG